MSEGSYKCCPACYDQYADHFAFCPKDGAQLQKHSKDKPLQRDGRICPNCRRCYGPELALCPRDAEPLIPYGLYAAHASSQLAPSAPQLCARCGMRGALGHAFCAMDGERLVALH